jgi:hypothetical protein
MATADSPGRRASPLYAVATAISLGCCGPIGLIALWLGPWSTRSKFWITLIWLVLFGPATIFYVGQMYTNPTPTPLPAPSAT